MMNPIFENRKNAYVFGIVWVVVIIVHFVLITVFYDIRPGIAFLDSFVYNGLFAAISLVIWYPVRYGNPRGRISVRSVATYAATGLILIPLWMLVGFAILRSLVPADDDYFYFLNVSFITRVATGVLFYGAVLLIYHLFIYSRQLQERRLNESRLNLLVKESELNVLRSQLNPHFLFNSLNSVSSLTLSDPEKARDMIIKLSEFLRYALRYEQQDKTRLPEELRNIGLYLEIEKTRFGEKLKFSRDVSGDCTDALIPNMILQPLFENSIKHGVYESTRPISILLRCRCAPDVLEISIRNNFDPEQVSTGGAGIGLRNVRNRMKLIYGRDDLVTIEKNDRTFEVKLIIPQK